MLLGSVQIEQRQSEPLRQSQRKGHREAWCLDWLRVVVGAKSGSIGKSRISIGLWRTKIRWGNFGVRRRIQVRRRLCIPVRYGG